jgi:hypothetical protein
LGDKLNIAIKVFDLNELQYADTRQETRNILHSSPGDHAAGLMAQKAPLERTTYL